ncbi:MAG: c-type cytochrome [Acidobacteriota bacterium]
MTFRRRAVAVAVALVAVGCRQDMHDAPRYEVYEASTSFADGRASRAAPTGTVARGWLREDEALYTGKVDGQLVDTVPFAIAHADLQRGQERFNIFCSPCHGGLGDGNGMVVQRGLRQAATYHQDRLRDERIGYFFDVITNGFGAMQGYAEQVPVRDRWLIAAYVRALQLSQYASVDDVPASRRGELEGTAGPPPAAAPPVRD